MNDMEILYFSLTIAIALVTILIVVTIITLFTLQKVKVYYESSHGNNSMGGHEIISVLKLMWWVFMGRIKPKEESTIYYIRKIETITGKKI